MTSGGRRNRTGNYPDPTSARSEARGIKFRSLSSVGYEGPVPEFPLLEPSPRELQLWEQLWRSPQAIAWAEESWRWPTIGMFVRVSVRAEEPDALAGVLAQLHRFADQVGMSPAGLKENGWEIVHPTEEVQTAPTRPAGQRRLRSVPKS